MRTRITVLAAIVALALMVTSVAVANDGVVVIVEGTGKLVAAGFGDVELEGGGRVHLRMRGDVTITDFAGDADLLIRSAGDDSAADSETDSATVELSDFTGVVTVEGSDFSISASGEFGRLAARGSGTVVMQGRGWYRTFGAKRGVWRSDGVRLSSKLDG